MGKPPKKRSLSDKVRKAKTTTEIKNNPFEVKINRKKFDVLGRKSKHDVGLPGVSRSKAITKVRDPCDDLTKLLKPSDLPTWNNNRRVCYSADTSVQEDDHKHSIVSKLFNTAC